MTQYAQDDHCHQSAPHLRNGWLVGKAHGAATVPMDGLHVEGEVTVESRSAVEQLVERRLGLSGEHWK